MNNTATQLIETTIEIDIIHYLKNNSDFFIRHSHILEKMTLPTTKDGNIASFNDFQNRKLSQKISKLEERNKRLITTAIQNIESTTKINNLTLNLLNSTNKDVMMNNFRASIQNDLSLDSAQVILKKDNKLSYQEIYNNSFKENKVVCLRTAHKKSPCLHEEGDVCMRSEALIVLNNAQGQPFGILTLGSRDIQRFHEGQGTELLEFLGSVIGYKLDSFLQE